MKIKVLSKGGRKTTQIAQCPMIVDVPEVTATK